MSGARDVPLIEGDSEPRTALEMFDRRLAADAESVFVVTPDGRERTYGEVDEAVGRLADVLAEVGVVPEDAVLLHLWNDPAWVVATLACWRLGAAIVACGGQSPSVEAKRRAEQLEVNVAVTADDLEPLRDLASIVIDRDGGASWVASSVALPSGPKPHDLAAVFFTSGTTGEPKPVRLSHEAVAAAPRTTTAAYSRSASFRPRTAAATAPAVSFNPFGHRATLGRVVFRMYVGRPVVLVRKFDVATLQTLARRYAFDTLQLTPATIHALAYTELEVELGSLRYVTSGTAPLPIATRDAFEQRYGVPVLVAYGSTEGSVTALERYDDVAAGRRGPGSVGRVTEGTEFRIVDADGNDVAPGEVGELVGRPRPDAALTVDVDGWHHTGDLARVDEHGILSITGRLGDVMIVGGFNVMPAQIEDLLRTHPAVRDAIVVPIPDDRLGDMPVAGIVWAGAPIDTDELAAHCRPSIEPFKVPRRWFVLDEIPLTAAGKPDRRAAEALAGALAAE
jgi:long-chain acyl-CoA synthetase